MAPGLLVPEIKAVSIEAGFDRSTSDFLFLAQDRRRLCLRLISKYLDARHKGPRPRPVCLLWAISRKRGNTFFDLTVFYGLSYQGPLVHVSCCMSFLFMKLFSKFHHNECTYLCFRLYTPLTTPCSTKTEDFGSGRYCRCLGGIWEPTRRSPLRLGRHVK